MGGTFFLRMQEYISTRKVCKQIPVTWIFCSTFTTYTFHLNRAMDKHVDRHETCFFVLASAKHELPCAALHSPDKPLPTFRTRDKYFFVCYWFYHIKFLNPTLTCLILFYILCHHSLSFELIQDQAPLP